MAIQQSTIHKQPAAQEKKTRKADAEEQINGQFDRERLKIATKIAQSSPDRLTPRDVIALRRKVGNLGAAKLVQTKLKVGAADDAYEREADQVAEQVMQPTKSDLAPHSQLQRQEEEEEVQAKPMLQRQAEEEDIQTKPILQRQEEEEEVQTRRARPSDGFEVGGGLEARIQSLSGNGRPLPDGLRSKMEERLGADFSGVRLQTGSQAAELNRKLNAQAFTYKNNIFLGEGKNNPGSPEGVRLLAHELTHTIQQGASPALNRKLSTRKVSTMASPSHQVRASLLQLKMAIISSKAHTRVLDKELTETDPKKKAALIDKASNGKVYKGGDLIDVDDTNTVKSGEELLWVRVNKTTKPEYIRGSKIYLSSTTHTSAKEEEENDTLEKAGDVTGKVSDVIGDTVGGNLSDVGKRLTDKTDKTSEEQSTLDNINKAQGPIDIVGSGAKTASGMLGMIKSAKDFSEGKNAKAKVDAAFDFASSAMDTGSGITGAEKGIAETVQPYLAETGAKLAENAGKWADGYSNMFGALSGGIKTIKGIVDLISMMAGDEKHTTDEYLSTIAGILGNGLETAKSVIQSIMPIVEVVTGTVSSALEAVAPGLDIAIAAVKSLFQGYYLIKSAYHMYRMQLQQKKAQAKLEEKGFGKAKVKEAAKFYSEHEAQISNIDKTTESKEKSLEKAKKKLAALDQKKNPKQTIKLKAQIQTLEDEIKGLKDRKAEQQKEIDERQAQARVEVTDATSGKTSRAGLTEFAVSEHELAAELGYTNLKRIIRQSIHIGANLAKVAGAIITLAAGPGAPAGVAVKAAASGVEVSLPFFRWLKQCGRNQAAKQKAMGQTDTVTQKIFNADKSTVAKMEMRKRHALRILQMVAHLNNFVPGTDQPTAKQTERLRTGIARVELYIRATGTEPKVLYQHNGNINKQIEILAKAMTKRELLGD